MYTYVLKKICKAIKHLIKNDTRVNVCSESLKLIGIPSNTDTNEILYKIYEVKSLLYSHSGGLLCWWLLRLMCMLLSGGETPLCLSAGLSLTSSSAHL